MGIGRWEVRQPGRDGLATADTSAFTAAIRALSGELETPPHSATELNRFADRLDQLGRRLHGLDWMREHEIGRRLTAAVWELNMARGLAGDASRDSVERAIVQLDAALTFADEGLRPRSQASHHLPTAEDTRDP